MQRWSRFTWGCPSPTLPNPLITHQTWLTSSAIKIHAWYTAPGPFTSCWSHSQVIATKLTSLSFPRTSHKGNKQEISLTVFQYHITACVVYIQPSSATHIIHQVLNSWISISISIYLSQYIFLYLCISLKSLHAKQEDLVTLFTIDKNIYRHKHCHANGSIYSPAKHPH